jgi:hypothetical protein
MKRYLSYYCERYGNEAQKYERNNVKSSECMLNRTQRVDEMIMERRNDQ